MVLSNLKQQNSGATIHRVETMRHIAIFLIGLLDKKIEKRDDPSFICNETKKLEDKSVNYFRGKYEANFSNRA